MVFCCACPSLYITLHPERGSDGIKQPPALRDPHRFMRSGVPDAGRTLDVLPVAAHEVLRVAGIIAAVVAFEHIYPKARGLLGHREDRPVYTLT